MWFVFVANEIMSFRKETKAWGFTASVHVLGKAHQTLSSSVNAHSLTTDDVLACTMGLRVYVHLRNLSL